MADATTGVHMLKLKPVYVSPVLIQGNKVVKWDDDSGPAGVPVTLRVDEKGYVLHWRDQNKDMDCLDISLIRDTRTGRYAKLPKDSRLREAVTLGTTDEPLEDKIFSIWYGTDMVNLAVINFAANSKETAQLWTKELFQLATNLLQLNASPLSFVHKYYTKLSVVTNSEGKIPVKNILKMFALHKDDKKRVEKALSASGFPSGKNDCIDPKKLTVETFMTFYRHLCTRQDMEKIFEELGAKKKSYMTVEQFVDFLNNTQRDPRLNEILYPNCDVKKAQALINMFEPQPEMASKGQLSQDGLLRYLLSDENAFVPPDKLDINEDMDQPLSHYFINSSHNTYLTGHQLTGKSSVEIYRQALLTGCRCVELDCWDGKGTDEEPIITHGYTMCTEVSFKEVVEAIAETAFKVSDYPVILSFENHCSVKQQAKMASHCRNIFGDRLLVNALDSNPLDPDVYLPSPEQLKGKILIKNKKRHVHKSKTRTVKRSAAHATNSSDSKSSEKSDSAPTTDVAAEPEDAEDKEASAAAATEPVDGVESGSESDSDSDDDEAEDEVEEAQTAGKGDKGTAGQESEAGTEMSALVIYIQPARFHSFEQSKVRNRSYETISFVETQATALLKEFPVDFVNYNKRQLSRIYPKGTRVDSSNYMPQIFWNAGCQLVALNFQTLDLAMQINLGNFEYNGRTGYILKPDFMRRKDRQFDPFAESTVDGIIAGTVSVKVISGQFLTDKKVGTYVEVDMYGLPADTVRKKFKTKVVPGNGINPVYDEEPFVFRKVVLPNLATLRIGVYDENNKLVGHRIAQVESLRPGYRHISLRNELNQPQGLATLFVHIKVGDYVPDAFADFAEALSNPIAYQSQLEKHSQQLAVLEEDFDVDEEAAERDSEPKQLAMKSDATPAFSRVKNLSIGSHPSQKVEMVASSQLTRVGSERSRNVIKQESFVSQTSQASGGPKSTSVPSSPLHVAANPMAGQSSDNAPGKPPATKLDVMQTTKLKDPDVLIEMSVEGLKSLKQFLKLAGKRDKEVEAISKKHEKARTNLQEIHEHQEEKLLLSHMKSKNSAEKTHRKSMRKASRRGSAPEDMSNKIEQEMLSLLSEQEQRHRDLRQTQIDSMMSLCHEHYQTELELQLRYHPLLYDTLENLLSVSNAQQVKRLDEIHDKEVSDLKKKLEVQTREEMKTLAKNHKDKNELARLKREANQKLIQLAVQERQKLQDLLEKRKGDAADANDKLLADIKTERMKVEQSLRQDTERRSAQMEKDLKSRLQPSGAVETYSKNNISSSSSSSKNGGGSLQVSTPQHLAGGGTDEDTNAVTKM